MSRLAGDGLRLHRRQFVWGPEPYAVYDDWIQERLGGGWLSRCPDLRCASVEGLDGMQWRLLGMAVETDPNAPSPPEQLQSAPAACVGDRYWTWAGRWMLLGGDEVHLDASGLLGCFHGRDGDGRPWASTSPALLGHILGDETPRPPASLEFTYERGLAWAVPPRSRFAGIGRLLPSAVLNLRSGETAPRALLPPIEPNRPYEATLDQLVASLQTALRRLPTLESPLWLSLSAGFDSRVMLAAAESSGVSYVPFSYISARMSAADRLLPARITSRLGRELLVLRPGVRRRGLERQRLDLVREHSAGHVSVGDAQPLLRRARDRLAGVSAGGWALGVGKALYRRALPDLLPAAGDVVAQLARRLGEPGTSPAVPALAEWLAWAAATPQPHLDWRDRFHLEQRLAGWQSSKEQVYDLQRLERFPAVNSGRVYSLMLGLNEHDRRERRHLPDLVERMCPELAGIPANPPVSSLGVLRVVGTRLRDDPVGAPLRAVRTLRQALVR